MSILEQLRNATLNTTRIALALVGAFALFGCQVSTQDAPRPNSSFKLTGPQTNCLANAAPVIQQFFDGNAKPDDVTAAWDCAGQALNMFTQYTRGGSSDLYTAKEVRSFLETYFLGDIRVSDELLVEVMRVKVALLGGTTETLTRAEIGRVQLILQTFRTESLRVLPYMDLISRKATVEEAQRDPQRMESAIIAFNTAMENLGGLLGQSTQTYDMKYLENLMNELQAIYSSGNRHWDGPSIIIKYIPTLAALKGFIIKPAPDKINPDEWQPLLVNGGRLYALYLRTNYLLKSRDLLSGEGLDQLSVALYELFDIIQGSIQAKPNKVIEFEQVDALFDEILRAGVVNWPLRPSTLRGLAHAAFNKVFNPPVNGVRAPTTGLSMPIFVHARDGIFGWIDMQRVWREVESQAREQEPSLIGRPIPLSRIREIWPKVRTPFKTAQNDLNFTFQRRYPLTIDDDGIVDFAPKAGETRGISQDSFNDLNWRVHFARIVALGWASEPNDQFKGVTKPEFEAFFYDARDLALDLHFIDPTDTTIWSTLFDQSNMFMLAGDADDHLGFSEGVDLVSYLMSSSHVIKPIFADAEANCPHEGFDTYGRPKVNIACFNDRLALSFADSYRFFPNWAKLSQKVGPAATRNMLLSLEAGARTSAKPGDAMAIGDVNLVTMLVQYIESIYTRFDKNNSGTIDYEESKQVYPFFHAILKKAAAASGIKSEKEIFGLYCYILRFGHPPESLLDKIYFKLIWVNSPSQFEKIHADRLMLLSIIGQLAAQK